MGSGKARIVTQVMLLGISVIRINICVVLFLNFFYYM
uniref:Uncharacterized protein n=1 Tax=Anguilla anguilla TaxID=7936 RepID=A0A0E9RTU4_ANGAN